MLFVVFGLPVARVRNVVSQVAAALSDSGTLTEVVEAESLGQLAAFALKSHARHALVIATHANRDWLNVLGAAGVPFAYLHADPIACVLGQPNLLEATRMTMMRLASFVELQAGLDCTVIDAEGAVAARTLLDVVCRSLAHSGSPALPMSGGSEPSQSGAQLEGELGATLKVALQSFDGLREGRRPQTLLASRLLFQDATREAAPVQHPIDVTGRARILFFGPYAYLPSGIWRARVVVSFSEQLVGHAFGLEVVAGYGRDSLAQASFNVELPGRRDMMIEFKHDDHTAPIEVRFSSRQGVFDGTLSLGYVEFSVGEPDTQPIIAPPLASSAMT